MKELFLVWFKEDSQHILVNIFENEISAKMWIETDGINFVEKQTHISFIDVEDFSIDKREICTPYY